MCGIAGYVSFDRRDTSPEHILAMLSLIAHRGPDGQGTYVSNPQTGGGVRAVLGHRRLSIIDLSESGKQPMCNEGGTVWTVFNGEIYNYVELKKELTARGHVFSSRSDTEVVVHAYEEYGSDFVSKLDGMFAFAVWDEARQVLLLARDRTGKKPLYYHQTGHTITFASEIKAILACPWADRRVSVARLPDYFLLGYVLPPYTLFEGISQIPPASVGIVDSCHDAVDVTPYWGLPSANEAGAYKGSFSDAANDFETVFDAAVKKRLMSDVPLGVLLSGGLDSSLVVESMARQGVDAIRTFSIGFDGDASYDERRYARLVAKHFGTLHKEATFHMEPEEYLRSLLWFHDQPYGDSAALPTYLLCNLTAKSVKVALNGDGADELFAGYDRFLTALRLQHVPAVALAALGYVVKFLPRQYGYYSLKRRLDRFFDGSAPTSDVFSNTLKLMTVFNRATLTELLGVERMRDAGELWSMNLMKQAYSGENDIPELERILRLNFRVYLPGDLNVKMDRTSMANSLETRSPFLDTAVIDFAFRLPTEMKITGGTTKVLLRALGKKRLPPIIGRRKKHGFGMPLGNRFRGELGLAYQENVLSDDARGVEYLNADYVRRLYLEHRDGTRDHSYKLWLVLQFEIWLRLLYSGELTKVPAASDSC